ncbi:MAG: DegV family protein [Clostridia bacterium]|nr:DegV family protein [Clostridia bacterium]
MKVAVVTDTNSGITPEFAKEIGVTVVPMPFLIDGEEYFENINLTQEKFYKKIMSGADVSTSQPNINSVADIWRELLKTHDEVVHIPMSSGLSSSCDTATNFAKEFNGKVEVVDNHRISVTQKQSVIDAVNLAKLGKSAKEIKEYLLATGMNSSIYIMLSTLKYLKKGGRITPAAALIANLLQIKPVLTIQGEKLDKFCQVMSCNQGKKRMIDQIVKELNTRFKTQMENGNVKVSIAYTYDKDKADIFKAEVDKALEPYGIVAEFVDPLSLSVSCHIGENALAVTICEYYKA